MVYYYAYVGVSGEKEAAVMAYSEAQKRATARYNARTYDRIEIKVPKGEKERISQAAQRQGKSLNAYIVSLIKQDLEGEDAENFRSHRDRVVLED